MKTCYRFILLLVAIAGFHLTKAQNPAPCTAPFFSEYVEGSSNNKALEIYNPTPTAINLEDYTIVRFNNGSTSPSGTFTGKGILLPGDVYVIANPAADTAILRVADTTSTITYYNGDDALMLYHNVTNDTLDIIGVIGVDPGTNWQVGSGATSEYTLVRKPTVQNGQLDWTIGATEWLVFPQNTFDSLGTHHMIPCGVLVNPLVSFAGTSTTVNEKSGDASVTITITSPNNNPTMVEVRLAGSTGNATNGADFVFTDTAVTFAASSSAPITLKVPIIDDTLAEPLEWFVLYLTNPSNNAVLGDSLLTIYIEDDDKPLPLYPIDWITKTDSATCVNDSLGVECRVRGIVYGWNLRPTGLQFYLIDQSGGINVFKASGNLGYTVQQGDSIEVQGVVDQYNGLSEIIPDTIIYFSSNNPLKTPQPVTRLDESTESEYIVFEDAVIVDPSAWINAGSGFNVEFTNGTDTIVVRIDNDMPFFGQPAPSGRVNVVGVGSQFDPTSPYCEGYQLFPTAFEPVTSVPELPQNPYRNLAHPNPSSGIVYISGNIQYEWGSVRSLDGKIIRNLTGETTLDLTSLPGGLYLIELIGQNHTYRGKLIIQP